MTPIQLLQVYRKVNKVAAVFEQATAHGSAHPMSKSIFASKIFWVNLLTAAAELTQVLSGTTLLPPGTLAIAASVINIGLRIVTNSAVHVIAPPK